eukprot:SAG11_NODE_61_length_19011_cov_49.624048_28_plen_105_part_00
MAVAGNIALGIYGEDGIAVAADSVSVAANGGFVVLAVGAVDVMSGSAVVRFGWDTNIGSGGSIGVDSRVLIVLAAEEVSVVSGACMPTAFRWMSTGASQVRCRT